MRKTGDMPKQVADKGCQYITALRGAGDRKRSVALNVANVKLQLTFPSICSSRGFPVSPEWCYSPWTWIKSGAGLRGGSLISAVTSARVAFCSCSVKHGFIFLRVEEEVEGVGRGSPAAPAGCRAPSDVHCSESVVCAHVKHRADAEAALLALINRAHTDLRAPAGQRPVSLFCSAK